MATKGHKILKTRLLVIPRCNGRQERRVTQITMSGKWLEALGFQPNQDYYVKLKSDGTLILSPTPFYEQLTPIGTLDELKAQFKALGISTERQVQHASLT